MNKNQTLLQKMILISPELLKKWKQMLIDDEQLTETDRRLKNILLNKTMNATDKWYNYRQVLLQNPHKFRYWKNENVQKSIDTRSENLRSIGTQSDRQENIRSIGTQSDTHKNIRSIGTQSDNIPIEHKPTSKYEDIENMDSGSNILEIKQPKLYQSDDIKVVKPQVQSEEEAAPSNIKIIKAKTLLEKNANAIMAESILRKKALAMLERGGKLKLQKLKKTSSNRVIGARYYDDVHNQAITVDLSTDDELEEEIDSNDHRPERNRKQVGKGLSTRITKLKTYKNKIPWILYKEKV